MKILNESIQLIHIKPNVPLSASAVSYALQMASANRMYAKFYTDKYFIQVNFLKDYTISVSSNITLPHFIQSLRRYESRGWTFSSVKQFVYQWMQLNRRQLDSHFR